MFKKIAILLIFVSSPFFCAVAQDDDIIIGEDPIVAIDETGNEETDLFDFAGDNIFIILIAILAGAGLIFWKGTSNKSSEKRKNKLEKSKTAISSKIHVNEEKEKAIIKEVKELEEKSKEKEEKTKIIINDAANEVKEVLSNNDLRETVKNILNKWK